MPIRTILRVLCLWMLSVLVCAARASTLEQVISHEHPTFQTYATATRLTVGKDGRVYVGLGNQPSGYLLRLDRNGGHKAGGAIAYCARNFAANADGVIATSDGHFTHAIADCARLRSARRRNHSRRERPRNIWSTVSFKS